MSPKSLTLLLILLLAAVCVKAEEASSQTADSDLNKFLLEENKTLRNIIANAVERKAFLVYDNGEINRIEINSEVSQKLSGNSIHSDEYLSKLTRLREIADLLKDYLEGVKEKDSKKINNLAEEAKNILQKEISDIKNNIKIYENDLKDIAALRQKVVKLQGELMASKKLEWIRRGLYGSARKGGGAKLMTMSQKEASSKKNNDLNVEILPDGTVKIVPEKKLIETELKDYVAKLVEDFNTAKPSVYKSYYHFPHAKVFSTEIEWISDPDKPVVDFDKLRATGWVKSRTNEIEVMYATSDKGVVRLNFSRIDKDGNVIITTDAIYTLTKIEDKWGISVVFAAASNLPLN